MSLDPKKQITDAAGNVLLDLNTLPATWQGTQGGLGYARQATAYPFVLGTDTTGAGWGFTSLASTYSTASASNVSTGSGTSVIASASGDIRVDASCVANNATQNDPFRVAVYESTVGVPSSGSAPNTGDTLIYQTSRAKPSANDNTEVTAHVVRTGRTPGTRYYYYHAAAAPSAGTTNVIGGTNQTTIIAEAVP